MSLLLSLLTAASASALVIDNGLAPPNPANVIDYPVLESVIVRNGGAGDGGSTTVELADGGQIGDFSVERFEVFGSSSILMTGGIVFDDIFAHDIATVTMNDGLIRSGLVAFGSSYVVMNGGTVSTGVSAEDTAYLTLNGGATRHVAAHIMGVVTVRGGTGISTINASNSGTIQMVGSGFEVNGIPVGLGEIPATFGTAGSLTGTLLSGEAFDVSFSRDSDPQNGITGRIVLVPEPSTGLLVVAGLLGLAGRRRARV